MKGRFISIEGVDGVGKTTQIGHLEQLLSDHGITMITTREPMSLTPFAHMSDAQHGCPRTIITHALHKKWHSKTAQALAFYADRIEHLETVIKPSLMNGRWVLCDRFIDSTHVYQCNIDYSLSNALEEHIRTHHAMPDLTIVLVVNDIDVILRRLYERSYTMGGAGVQSSFDTLQGDELHAIQERFIARAREYHSRCTVINGHNPPQEVAQAIARLVVSRFSLRTS